MEFQIKNYNLTLDAALYGFEGDGKLEFHVIWDAPVGNPKSPELWEKQKRDLLAEIEQLLDNKIVPIVAIFTPLGRTQCLSEQEFHNSMEKRFKSGIVNGEPAYLGIRLKK